MLQMAGINALPPYGATAIIGGGAGRSLQGGFGGVTDTTDASAINRKQLARTFPFEAFGQADFLPLRLTRHNLLLAVSIAGRLVSFLLLHSAQ
jgi:hypothetical protein